MTTLNEFYSSLLPVTWDSVQWSRSCLCNVPLSVKFVLLFVSMPCVMKLYSRFVNNCWLPRPSEKPSWNYGKPWRINVEVCWVVEWFSFMTKRITDIFADFPIEHFQASFSLARPHLIWLHFISKPERQFGWPAICKSEGFRVICSHFFF